MIFQGFLETRCGGKQVGHGMTLIGGSFLNLTTGGVG